MWGRSEGQFCSGVWRGSCPLELHPSSPTGLGWAKCNVEIIAQIDELCAEIGLVKKIGVNLDPFWASPAALVVLIVFLVPCLS